jgi:membrane-associated phospholipid phosphatase
MLAAAGWTSFMAWGRTHLDVHWLSDAAAGALLGISLALIVDGILTRLSAQFRWLRPHEGLGRAVVVPDKE